MSTQVSRPRPAPLPPMPGMTLVRRLDKGVRSGPTLLAHILPRLSLYAMPALVWLLARGVGRPGSSGAAAQFVLVFSFAWLGAAECFGAGRLEGINQEHTGAIAVIKALIAASSASLLLLRLLGHELPSARFCLQYLAILALASVAGNLALRVIFAAHRPLSRLIVVNAAANGAEAGWNVVNKEVARYERAGAIRLDEFGHPTPFAGRLSTRQLVRELLRERADAVLISASPAAATALSRQIRSALGMNAPAVFAVGPGDGGQASDAISEGAYFYLLNAGAAPAESLHYRILKRSFDIAFALTALVFGAPLLLFIAAAIRFTSCGPILFAQDRVGWNSRVFRMYKFRTMQVVSPAESDTHWTSATDPRRTAVGSFLRRYSLDELPQFFNVLKGDMSVVGPRPERPYFVSSFRREIDEYHRRHQLKVGITGWAQVNGLRGDTCIRTRLMYDLYYLQNWGLIFDLRIILRTALCIFSAKNAY